MNFITNIRMSSATLHSASEHTGYIKRILDKKATKEGYAEYIYNLAAMYKAIEDGLDKHSNNETIKDFVTKELYRSALIEKDVKHLLGENANSLKLLPSTVASITRIKEISNSQPELVVAYAYTRFLADLFGGRLFYDLLSNEYKIADEGLNYYNFKELGDMREYTMNYAAKLDSINLHDNLKQEFINEVNNAYIYNLAISNELEIKLHPVKRDEKHGHGTGTGHEHANPHGHGHPHSNGHPHGHNH